MAKRNIVKIDENKCNGCGLCVSACAEGAIQLINGKAKLVSEVYCDGLGACLGHCPQDAITIEERNAAEFDEKAVHEHLKTKAQIYTQARSISDGIAHAAPPTPAFTGCPGMMARTLKPRNIPVASKRSEDGSDGIVSAAATDNVESQLAQWPVQLKLVSPMAPYFAESNLLLAADCVPFAMGDFHQTLLKDRSIAIFCPKLDDCTPYVDKLAQLIQHNNLKSLTVVHMEVPCCSGLLRIADAAIAKSGVKLDYEDITISLDGKIKNRSKVACK
jgi:Pyruvate/2-oxoacid:ferredoxin oxidoreductase delta subunit